MNLLQISKSDEYHFHHGEVEMAFGIARELLAGNLEQVALEYDKEHANASDLEIVEFMQEAVLSQ